MNVNKVTSSDIKKVFAARDADTHKGIFGHVGIIAGSPEFSGAAKLANMACAAGRGGAGIVRLLVPKGIESYVAPSLLESTLFALPDNFGHLIYDESYLNKGLSALSAIAVGPGLGCDSEVYKTVIHVLHSDVERKILDADALNALAKYGLEPLRAAKNVLLTPHVKEFSRLSGFSVEEILQNPVENAMKFAKEYAVTVLLKGHKTYVSDGDNAYLVERGSAGMATGGSGDVLTGFVCGIAGYTSDLPLAACAAAYVCGVAGELAANELTDVCALPRDTIRYLPAAVKLVREAQ